MSGLLKCLSCKVYTLHDKCPRCGAKTGTPGPAKFSPEDPYGAYRRRLKLLARADASASRKEASR